MDEVRETYEELEEGDHVTIVVGPPDGESSYRGTVDRVRDASRRVDLIDNNEHPFFRVFLRPDDEARRGVLGTMLRPVEDGREPTRDVLSLVRP